MLLMKIENSGGISIMIYVNYCKPTAQYGKQ
jgi:hypothetical protein